MHILFIDESGTPPKPGADNPKYFVVGGIIIPEGVWHRVRDAMFGLKLRRKIRGEIKWRYFSPHNDDPQNPMRELDQPTRDSIRRDIIKIITSETAIKTLACISSAAAAYEMASIATQEDIYHGTYKPVTERFQYHLQDLSRAVGTRQLGIIVADHRGSQDDKRLRDHHLKLLYASATHITKYENLVEGLFLTPSNQSIGIQFADILAGSVWRKFERGDSTWYDLLEPSLRRNAAGSVDGHGIVKFPKKNWR